jgi:hypothetical protein
MSASPCGSFGSLNLSADEGLDGYNQLAHALAMFQEINRYWHNAAAGIQEWWNGTKEANEYQVDIDEHDGKTLSYQPVEVWK